jgi:hypothetical protein
MSLAGTLQHNAMMYILDALNSMYEFETSSEAQAAEDEMPSEGSLFAEILQ